MSMKATYAVALSFYLAMDIALLLTHSHMFSFMLGYEACAIFSEWHRRKYGKHYT